MRRMTRKKSLHSLDSRGGSPEFLQTSWSLVRRASDPASPAAREALETLCRTYWFPTYAFVRRQGQSPADAQDLTQAFFAHLLKTHSITRADPRLGKFRSFLLGALKHFLADNQRRNDAWKRGGGVEFISIDEVQAEDRYQLEPVDDRTPDKVFDQRWTVSVLEAAMIRLRAEFQAAGKQRQFEILKPFLSAEGGDVQYTRAASDLQSSAKAVAVAVHRIRLRFRYLVRSVIADTVSTPDEVEEEYRRLFA